MKNDVGLSGTVLGDATVEPLGRTGIQGPYLALHAGVARASLVGGRGADQDRGAGLPFGFLFRTTRR